MKKTYLAFIEREGDLYGISFPDVPGCFSSADSIEEAEEMASEALHAHLELLSDMDDPIPPARSLKELAADVESEQPFAVLPIRFEPQRGRKKRMISVRMDEKLLEALDEYAAQTQTNRTELIERSARALLAKNRPAAD